MQLKLCEERLTSIKVPHDFNRAVKGLTHVKHWKGRLKRKLYYSMYNSFLPPTASEFRSWLLYYSLPVLHEILPNPYFAHYALLVAAMHIYLGDSITQSDFRWAELVIHRFCESFAELYGTSSSRVYTRVVIHVCQTFRTQQLHHECASFEAHSRVCQELGTTVGVFMFFFREHEWTAEETFPWN